VSKQLEAVYENGVLRPLEPLNLDEHQQVTVTVADVSDDPLRAYLDLEYMERLKKEVTDLDRIPTRDEIRAITSKDKTSWAEAVISQRKDRF
jgi:predicted DNA-binding antitoxin AbrB/MazE fold protein